MISKELEDLLSLLAAVIMADKRVFAEEIDVFLKATGSLKIAFDVEPNLSEAKLLSWYEINKATVKEEVTGHNFKTWLYDRLDRLAHFDGKPSILDAMNKISLADGELHVSERALMVLTARRWGMDVAAY